MSDIWAFEEEFTGDLSNWTPARWHSGAINGSHPGHTLQADIPGYGAGLYPPDDIFIDDASDSVWIGCGNQCYGDSFLRCDQPFDLTDGGVIETEVYLQQPNSFNGTTQIFVTSKPYTTPEYQSGNSNGCCPRYGFSVKLNIAQMGPGGAHPAPEVYTFNEWVETFITPTVVGTTLLPTTVPVSVRIEFTRTAVSIYGNGSLWAFTSWTLPTPLTTGWVYLGAHNHCSKKYTETWSYNARFGSLRFDGPVMTACQSYRAPDGTSMSVDGNIGMNIGHSLPWTGGPVAGPTNLTIPGVPSGVTAARLMWTASTSGTTGADFRYSLNGNPTRIFPIEFASASNTLMFSESIIASDLVTGTNNIAISMGGSHGWSPFVGNVTLLIEEADPTLRGFRIGTTPVAALKLGATTIVRAFQGLTQVWGTPYSGPPLWTATPAIARFSGLSGTWAAVTGQNWVGSAATVTITAASGTWDLFTPLVQWTDTAFTNINSGGSYQNYPQGVGDTWNTSVAGQVTTNHQSGRLVARRLDAASSNSQFVRVTLADGENAGLELSTHNTGDVTAIRQAYTAETHASGYVKWWLNEVDTGAFSNFSSSIFTDGPTTFEMRVTEAGVATFYINDVLRAGPYTYSTLLTGKYQTFALYGTAIATDASGGDYGIVVPSAQTWTRSAATLLVTATSSTWAAVGPQTWTSSTGSVVATGTSSTWSTFAPTATWTDTDFININSGGNYQNYAESGGDTWITSVAGQVRTQYSSGRIYARRLDAASTAYQFVKITVADGETAGVELATHLAGNVTAVRQGYTAEVHAGAGYVKWWCNGVDTGFFSNPGSAVFTDGPTTFELRVNAGVASYYINDILRAGPFDYNTAGFPSQTGQYQAFCNYGTAITTDASGGDYSTVPLPQTWTRSAAAVTVTAASGIWFPGAVPPPTMMKYRTFDGSDDVINWTLGNNSGTASVPQTLVAVVRRPTGAPTGAQVLLMTTGPDFDPVDWYFNAGTHNYYQGANPTAGPSFPTNEWQLVAVRSISGAPFKWSVSSYSGSAWPTPTHTTTGTTHTAKNWPTGGSVMRLGASAAMNVDIVCVARFNVALSDAQINAMTGGLSVIQGTSGITNLWVVGQATPADTVGTSTVSSTTGTTLSSGDSPFPV